MPHSVATSRDAVAKGLAKLKPETKPEPSAEAATAFARIILAKATCELIIKTIQTRMATSIAAQKEAEDGPRLEPSS